MTEHTLDELESLWLMHLLTVEPTPPDGVRMLAVQVQAWSWAYQCLHGRGVPPPEKLWCKVAGLMGWQGDGVLAAYKPLPVEAEDILARFG